MDKDAPPPSYNETKMMLNPSAPMAQGGNYQPGFNQQPPVPAGWQQPTHQQIAQYPQYPQLPQNQNYPTQPNPQFPVINQQPLVVGTGAPVVIINSQPIYGQHPCVVACPHCHEQVSTKVTHKIGVVNHILAGVLCCMGLCPCALIPYLCGDCLSDVEHKCPKCNGFIGSYSPMNSNRRYYNDPYNRRHY